MSPYTITALGWQYALREYGKIVSVHDTREAAERARREAQQTL